MMADMVQQMTNQVSKMLSGGRISETAGGMLGAGASMVRGVADQLPPEYAGMLKPMEWMFTLPKAMLETVDALRDWNESLHKANTKFAEFSGSMAAVEAYQEARTIYYQQDRGEARAASADYQAESKHRLDESLAPLEDAFANMANQVSGSISNALAQQFEQLTQDGELVEQIEQLTKDIVGFIEWSAKVYKEASDNWKDFLKWLEKAGTQLGL